MQKADYQEAWAWVHFLLHESPETRLVLLDYLHELISTDNPGKLRDRLTAAVPHIDERLLQYASTLPKGPVVQVSNKLPH